MAKSSGSLQSWCCLLLPRHSVVWSTPFQPVLVSVLFCYLDCPSQSPRLLSCPSWAISTVVASSRPLTLLACLDAFASSHRVSCHCCVADFEIQPRHWPLVGVTSLTLGHLPLEVLEPHRLVLPQPPHRYMPQLSEQDPHLLRFENLKSSVFLSLCLASRSLICSKSCRFSSSVTPPWFFPFLLGLPV